MLQNTQSWTVLLYISAKKLQFVFEGCFEKSILGICVNTKYRNTILCIIQYNTMWYLTQRYTSDKLTQLTAEIIRMLHLYQCNDEVE